MSRAALPPGVRLRPGRVCAVALCPSLTTARRVVCCIHAGARAFTVAGRIWAPIPKATPGGRPDAPEEWLCARCAIDRIHNGQATILHVVDNQRIHERNRAARTAAERAACGRCGRFIVGDPAPPSPARSRARPAGPWLYPPRSEVTR